MHFVLIQFNCNIAQLLEMPVFFKLFQLSNDKNIEITSKFIQLSATALTNPLNSSWK